MSFFKSLRCIKKTKQKNIQPAPNGKLHDSEACMSTETMSIHLICTEANMTLVVVTSISVEVWLNSQIIIFICHPVFPYLTF